jgi:hypothetical protein
MDYFSNQQNLESKIQSLNSQKEELNQLWHIYKTAMLANIIDEYVNEKIFEKYKIKKVEISAFVDRDEGIPLSIYVSCYNEKGYEVRNALGLNDKKSKLNQVCKGFRVLNQEYLGDFFQNHVSYPFVVYPGLKEEIIDELLSSELKLLMKHEELQNELSHNDLNVKKIKI